MRIGARLAPGWWVSMGPLGWMVFGSIWLCFAAIVVACWLVAWFFYGVTHLILLAVHHE